jgi:hypothetical protein
VPRRSEFGWNHHNIGGLAKEGVQIGITWLRSKNLGVLVHSGLHIFKAKDMRREKSVRTGSA